MTSAAGFFHLTKATLATADACATVSMPAQSLLSADPWAGGGAREINSTLLPLPLLTPHDTSTGKKW